MQGSGDGAGEVETGCRRRREGREETIMTSFNSFSPTLFPSLLPRQRSERIAQFGNHKSPLNMGAFGLSVSCCNKNVRQVCETRGSSVPLSLLSTHMHNTPNKSLTDTCRNHTAQTSQWKPVQQCE